ncbi:Dabb family protein [Microbacterium phosphatis]|uniref:Dabb family protein n=1 Tax=Microbacterium phosphatis TaxID=3140248 RepID=UPI0031407FC0
MSLLHTVVFTLAHAPGSPEEARFLDDGVRILTAIPGVQDFTVRAQVSPKSDKRWQFAMRFEDQAAYHAYDRHPDHQAFVAERWLTEVADFQEYDFVDRG